MSLAGSVLTGTIWSVAMRWSVRILGFVSIAVLARLLSQDDFGLMAMSGAITGLTLAFFTLGIEFAVIRKQDLDDEYLHNAWTMKLVQGLGAASFVAILAPFAPLYFDDPRVTAVLWVAAAAVAIEGCENIGVVLFRREMNFAADFKFNLMTRALGTVVTLALAFWFRNYWALVLGMVAGSSFRVAISYAMHDFRPRPCFTRMRELWSFSKWMIIFAFNGYLLNHGDKLILGGLANAKSLGLFSMSKELGEMPSTEVVLPASRAITPAFAKLLDEPERLRAATVRALAVLTTITAPMSFGLAVVSPEAVAIVLGDKWADAAPLVAVTCLYGSMVPLFSVFGNLLVVSGYERGLAGLRTVQSIAILGLLTIGYQQNDLLGAAYGALIGQVISAVMFWNVTGDIPPNRDQPRDVRDPDLHRHKLG
jgi:O-antigen/teichoic acid export membrane protein